jgi:hypothetical protein
MEFSEAVHTGFDMMSSNVCPAGMSSALFNLHDPIASHAHLAAQPIRVSKEKSIHVRR